MILTTYIYCCESNQIEDLRDSENLFKDPVNGINIQFKMSINRDVYIYTNYGEPPQIAIWLENSDSSFYRTVWVTNRAGKNDWIGKVECLVALPYWDHRRQTIQKSQSLPKEVDGYSGPTPKGGEKYYIEVNASGDYNNYFSYWSKQGLPDSDGNGQPSIIYSGQITAIEGMQTKPKLIGRTNQWSRFSDLYKDTEKITSAKRLVENITVEVVQ